MIIRQKINFILFFFCKIINNNNFVKITINLWHYYYYYYHYAHRAVYFITSSMRLANQSDLYKWKSEIVLIRTLLFANKQDQQRSLSDRSFFGIRRKTVTCSMLTNKKTEPSHMTLNVISYDSSVPTPIVIYWLAAVTIKVSQYETTNSKEFNMSHEIMTHIEWITKLRRWSSWLMKNES